MRARDALIAAAALLAQAGCDLVLGYQVRDAAPVDAAADASPDAPPPPIPDPACWSSPATYQAVGTLSGARYYVHPTPLSWAAAGQVCSAAGAHLAVVVEDDAEWRQVFAAVGVPGASGPHWVGLDDITTEGMWVSATGEVVRSNVEPGEVWGGVEPNNAGTAGEDCGAGEASGLSDLPCEALHTAICECEREVTCDDAMAGYQVLGGLYTRADAVTACAENGKQLVVISSPAELDAVIDTARQYSNSGFVWIDASDAITEEDWRASSGCRPYLRWGVTDGATLEPTGEANEDCAAVMAGTSAPNGAVFDLPCEKEGLALCEAR